jgi:GNAT superfamily N-acetyltransferase
MSAPLPSVPLGQIIPLDQRNADELQALLAANEAYYLLATGAPAAKDEAVREMDSRPPETMPHEAVWNLGWRGEDRSLLGFAQVIAGLLAPQVWHIGFFLVRPDCQHQGVGRAFHSALLDWMRAQGARWIRLGVIVGNARGEDFWQQCGYCEARRRENVTMGSLSHTIRVLVLLPEGDSLAEYQRQVPRDHPDSD